MATARSLAMILSFIVLGAAFLTRAFSWRLTRCRRNCRKLRCPVLASARGMVLTRFCFSIWFLGAVMDSLSMILADDTDLTFPIIVALILVEQPKKVAIWFGILVLNRCPKLDWISPPVG